MQQGMATVLHIDHGTSCSIITRMVMAVVGVHHLGSAVCCLSWVGSCRTGAHGKLACGHSLAGL